MSLTYDYVLASHKNKDGTQKLVLRVTFNRSIRYYEILIDHQKIFLKKKEFDKIGTSSIERLRIISEYINDDRKRVRRILKKIHPFTFDKFKSQYGSGNKLSDCFDRKISELKQDNKFPSAENYEAAKKAIIKFNDCKVGDVNDEYVTLFSKSYPHIYLQRLRHILRREDNHTKIKINDQQKFKIPIPEVSVEVLKKYSSVSIARTRSVDLWMMSYWGGGMNTKDWVFLKDDQIENGLIQRPRSKNGQPLVILINDQLEHLIGKYYDPKYGYAFQFIDHSLDSESKFTRYKTFLSNMRRSLRQVREELGIAEKITPYVARHTHANILKNRGASMEDIQDSLGQKDIRSTKAYTGSMNLKNKKRISDLL